MISADWGFAGEATFNHFVPGKMLAHEGEDIDDLDATYLVTMRILQAWPYDERARLIGENFFEYRSRRIVTKPDPVDVITPAEARRLLCAGPRQPSVSDPKQLRALATMPLRREGARKRVIG
jgi:hypothetical protein